MKKVCFVLFFYSLLFILGQWCVSLPHKNIWNGFLMFAGDIEMQQLAEMCLAQFFGPNGSYFVRKWCVLFKFW